MRRLLLALIVLAGCSKSTPTPQNKPEIKGTYQMTMTADFYAEDGSKVTSVNPNMAIKEYIFNDGELTGEGPNITGTYIIYGDSLRVTWSDKYKSDSFTGKLSIKDNNHFSATSEFETDQYVENKHVTRAVFIREFDK